MEDRRAFEDRLAMVLEQARAEGTLVAVIVGEMLGLLVIHSRFGVENGARAVAETSRRLKSAVEGIADLVARIGEAEWAVLLTDVTDRSEADDVVRRITAAFDEPYDIDGEPARISLAMGVNVGPGRRRTDMDLLWRTAEDSGQERSNVMQRLVDDVRGDARGLDEVGQLFADQGVSMFGLEACVFEVAGRSWHAPPVLPDRPYDGDRPLRTAGRLIGWMRWWGPVPDESDSAGVDLILGHVAAAFERATALEESDVRSRTDPLTGLLNRDGLTHELRELDRPYAVGIIDLDHFKQVNDLHGHDVGDRLLADLAELLQRGRSGDLIARWGGEEIVLVMPTTTIDGAVARLQRLLEEAKSFVRVADVGQITFSAGVTGSNPDEAFSTAIRRADEALYRAKAGGRARVEVG